MSKKGQLEAFGKLGISVAILAIALVTAFMVMSNARTEILATDGVVACVNSTGCNATQELIEATATIPGWIPIAIVATIGSILVGIAMAMARKS